VSRLIRSVTFPLSRSSRLSRLLASGRVRTTPAELHRLPDGVLLRDQFPVFEAEPDRIPYGPLSDHFVLVLVLAERFLPPLGHKLLTSLGHIFSEWLGSSGVGFGFYDLDLEATCGFVYVNQVICHFIISGCMSRITRRREQPLPYIF
jgi:hypothetical protein